jgi:glycosyltransferase involved in cell wall biosynthesis
MSSVIIPVKDEEENLKRLIPTLLEQRPLEIIVAIAPSTTDRSRELVESYAPHARWVEGGMPAAGRNAGAKAARGEYLFFMDADVLPGSPLFLAETLKELEYRSLDCATVDNHPRTENISHRLFYRCIQNPGVRIATKLRHPRAIGTCIIARREAHEAIGGFDENVEFYEDGEYVTRMHRYAFKFGVLNPSLHITTDARRLEKDGIAKVMYLAMKAEAYRALKGEIMDISVIDSDYFSHKKPRFPTRFGN